MKWQPKGKRPSLNYIYPSSVCAEIGVWEGDFSNQILHFGNPAKLHLIDPWISQYPKSGRWYSGPQAGLDNKFEEVSSSFANDERVVIHREFSSKVQFEKDYFDWVYIDGDHTYKVVKADLCKYYSLIKTGGFLCGHDYGPSGKDTNGGPRRAVDEFCEERNLSLLLKGDCREFVIKKK